MSASGRLRILPRRPDTVTEITWPYASPQRDERRSTGRERAHVEVTSRTEHGDRVVDVTTTTTGPRGGPTTTAVHLSSSGADRMRGALRPVPQAFPPWAWTSAVTESARQTDEHVGHVRRALDLVAGADVQARAALAPVVREVAELLAVAVGYVQEDQDEQAKREGTA